LPGRARARSYSVNSDGSLLALSTDFEIEFDASGEGGGANRQLCCSLPDTNTV
jgi:hypothetical protein